MCEHHIENCQELMHARDQGDRGGLAGAPQPGVKGANHRVPFGGNQGRHIQHAANRGSTAPAGVLYSHPPHRASHSTMTQRGFILLDVLLALTMLAIALPVLLGLANRDIELLGCARAITAATLLAQEKLVETEVNGFPPIGEQRGDFQVLIPSMATEQDVDYLPRAFWWTRTVNVSPLEEIREVRVRVSWPRGRTEEVVEVTSYVFQE
jgi:general secretion pathway protein I